MAQHSSAESAAGSAPEDKRAVAFARFRGMLDGRTAGVLALIVAVGLLLRLWGIGWGLPDARHPLATYHPDELINLGAARAADIPHGQFDIKFYSYGAFYFYLVSFAHTFGEGWGVIPTAAQPPPGAPPLSEAEQMQQLAQQNAALFLTGRLVTALMGTLTILVVFACANRCFGKNAGLLSALFYAIAPLAVVHAHFLTVDVPVTLFVALALMQSARLLTMPTWREYGLAALWVGLSAATKYNAGLVIIAPLAAHFLNLAPGACRKHRAAQLVVLLTVSLLVFLIACPGPMLNWEAFWEGTYPGSGVRYELFEHSRLGHGNLFTQTGPGWWYHLVVSLPVGLGVPLLLLSLAGLVLACIRRTAPDKILLAFFLLYFGTTGVSAVRFARYLIPLFPVLCVWAARFATEPFPQRDRQRIAQAAGALVLLLTVAYTVSLTHLMTLRDPRDAAADYLQANAPQSASVAFAKIPWFFSPPLSPLFSALDPKARAKAATETTRFQLRIPTDEWDTSVLNPPPDYIIISRLESLHDLRLRQQNAVQFMAQPVFNSYRKIVFAPPAPVFGVPQFGDILPEDLLYILPTLTVYQK